MSITHIESVSQLTKILSGSKEKLSVSRFGWSRGQLIICCRLSTFTRHGSSIFNFEKIFPSSSVIYVFRCGPCHTIAPTFEALSKKYTNVNFLKCDVDAARDVASMYSVSAMLVFGISYPVRTYNLLDQADLHLPQR